MAIETLTLDKPGPHEVLIRTAACVETAAGWRVEARAGAGLVEGSDPVAEREETAAKIAAIARALTEPCP